MQSLFFPPSTPSRVIGYFQTLKQDHPFDFRLSRPRKTKLGDIRIPHRKEQPCRISVNRDLPIELYCLVLAHEIAHLMVYERFGRKVRPHGPEWKEVFSDLIRDLIRLELFSAEHEEGLRKQLQSPKATLNSNLDLWRSLQGEEEGPYVGDLDEGDGFRYKGRVFMVLKKNRSRALCREVRTKRSYHFPFGVTIQPVG